MIDLSQRQALILAVPCFSKFSAQEAGELAQKMTEVEFKKNEVIVTEKEALDAVFIITSGLAEVSRASLLICTLKAGETIGLSNIGFFSKTGLRTATVKALSKLTLLRLSLSEIQQFFQKYPQLNQAMAQTANQMLRMQLIKKAAPFSELSHQQLRKLFADIEEFTFNPGDIIFSQGDSGDCCYLICDGKIEIYKTENGNEHHVATLEQHAVFGETSLLTSSPRNSSARVIEKAQLLILKKIDFLELVSRYETVASAMTEMMYTHAYPIINKKVLTSHFQAEDGDIIITLKNPEQNTYYQLPQEGWFIYQQLNGKRTLQQIVDQYSKIFSTTHTEYVYQLIDDLIKGDFATYHEETEGTLRLMVITYNAKGFHETTGNRFEECFPITQTGRTWVNLENCHDDRLINQLGQYYNLHPLTIENLLDKDKYPKVEEFSDYIYISLKALVWNKDQHKSVEEHIIFILGKEFILSFHEGESHIFADITERIHARRGQYIRERGPDYLLYRLLDTIVDQYFVILEDMGELIEQLDEDIFTNPSPESMEHLHSYRQQILAIRKIIWPTRKIVGNLLNISHGFIEKPISVYLKDLYDHVIQAMDTVDNYRDTLVGTLDHYLSGISTRMNEVMKVLTIIATLFIPVTFVTGLYGMNFHFMPELSWKYGYFVVLGVVFSIISGLLIFFKRKKWI